MIHSRQNGWRPGEEEPLANRFGDDTTLDLLERSPVDPRVMIVWVGWYRLPPSIYVVDFRRMAPEKYPFAEEFRSAALIKAHPDWAPFFPSRE
jgi:hypothetical protein